MLECKICGTKFNAVIERHYLARDNGKTGLAVAFGSTAEECLYDAFDCPMCGCQVIAKSVSVIIFRLSRRMKMMNRSETLDKAKACVCGQRENEYGSPEDNFAAIAGFGASIKALNSLQMMLP